MGTCLCLWYRDMNYLSLSSDVIMIVFVFETTGLHIFIRAQRLTDRNNLKKSQNGGIYAKCAAYSRFFENNMKNASFFFSFSCMLPPF